MKNRTRIALGSLGGAVAIHLVFLACSSGRAGDDASSGMDSAVVPDGPSNIDSPASPIDAVRSEVASISDSVVRAEVGQAEAQTPPPDAGACTCTPPTVRPSTFYFVAPGGMTLRSDYSTASSLAIPALVGGQPGRQVVGSGDGYLSDGSRVQIYCSGTSTLSGPVAFSCSYTTTGTLADGGAAVAYYVNRDVSGAVVVTTDTEVTIRTPTMTLMTSATPPATATLTDVQFHGYGQNMLRVPAAYVHE